MPARRNSKPTFVGLFCGCGGFDLGFEQAGFRNLGAFDWDPAAIATYNANLSSNAIQCDLTSLNSLRSSSRPDVVIAGPPCQGFSTLGRRNPNDPRNSLLVHAAQLAISANPSAIILENVSGALSGEHSEHWRNAESLLSAAGFSCSVLRITGTDFGLPQIRKRIVLVASRATGISLSLPVPNGKSTFSLATALANVEGLVCHSPRVLHPKTNDYRIAVRIRPNQKLCNVRGGERSVPTWEIPEVFGHTTASERELLQLIQRLRRQIRCRDVGDADPVALPDLRTAMKSASKRMISGLVRKGFLRDLGERFDLVHTFNGKFRRLSWDNASPAVDTRFGEPRYFLHPDEHRGLSVREAARIQGFPDSFEFHGSRSQQYRQVGNAVSPVIGRHLAIAIKDALL